MNTNQMTYLIEISKTKSMLKASEKLYITPQALSKAMVALEKELGMPLLNRSNSGVSLTNNGLWLVDISTKYLQAIKERQRHYQHYLNIAQFPHTGELILPIEHCCGEYGPLFDFIFNFSAENKDLKITVKEYFKDELYQKILKSEIPLAFVCRPRSQYNYIDELDSSLIFTALDIGDLYLWLSSHLTTSNHKSISLKKVFSYPLCTLNDAPNALDNLSLKLNHAKVSTENFSSFAQFTAAIKSGQYAALMAKYKNIANDPATADIKAIKIRDDIQIAFGYVRAREDILRSNEDFFISGFTNYLNTLTPPN